ncbi:MAG: alpha/beta hydrolase [Lachnospiraceae bacterium]|nr:alpha/beta hydrolase [Lachnospiraceae bacterium]
MVKTETVFKSSDKAHMLMVTVWAPDNKQDIKAVVQIAHGMKEYMERYSEFAQYLTDNGIAVVGNDHLGHGRSTENKTELGFFSSGDSSDILVKDMYRLTKRINKAFPGVPKFLIGHSMGSFLTRRYLTIYGNELDGVIIMGTGSQSQLTLKAGLGIIKLLSFIYGDKHRSNFVNKIVFGGYNKKISEKDTGNWLTKDQSVVDTYNGDPYCNFVFTLNGFKWLFENMEYVQKPDNYMKTPKDIPMLIISGKDDPVGNYGKGVKKVYDIYKKCGVHDVSMKLYENDRHELINETDKEVVYADILDWIVKNKESRL